MSATSDASLLKRYTASRDPEVFAALVERYAGMVYNTCRRMLGNHALSEEVAQECFFELFKRSGAIRDSVPNWLHTVAVRRSANVIRSDMRRRRRERDAALAKREVGERESAWSEVSAALDKALAELPNELRELVVRRYLVGQTQQEVAATLGIGQATVSRRLAKGVDQLGRKLRRSGIVLPAAALATLLSQNVSLGAPEAVVAALGKMTLAGAAGHAAGGTVAAGTAASAAAKTGLVGGFAMKVAIVGVAVSAIAMTGLLVAVDGQPAKPPASAPAATQPAAAEKTSQIALDLTDGSHLIGAVEADSIGLRAEALEAEPTPATGDKMTVRLPMNKIDYLETTKEDGRWTVHLLTGDQLTGEMADEAVELSALFGEVRIDLGHITKITWLGEGPQDLSPLGPQALFLQFEAEGDVLKDSSGSGKIGTLHGPLRVESIDDGESVLLFDGLDDYVEIPNVELKELTFAAWVLSSNSNINNDVVFRLKCAENILTLQGSSSGGLSFHVDDGEAIAPDRIAGRWTHVAVTYDGTTIRFYRNGELTETDTLGGRLSKGTLYLGGADVLDEGRSYWNGAMDDVVVYDRPLSDSQIMRLFTTLNRSRSRLPIPKRPEDRPTAHQGPRVR